MDFASGTMDDMLQNDFVLGGSEGLAPDGYLDRMIAHQQIDAAIDNVVLDPNDQFMSPGGPSIDRLTGQMGSVCDDYMDRLWAREEMDAAIEQSAFNENLQARAMNGQQPFAHESPFGGLSEHHEAPGYSYPQYGSMPGGLL